MDTFSAAVKVLGAALNIPGIGNLLTAITYLAGVGAAMKLVIGFGKGLGTTISVFQVLLPAAFRASALAAANSAAITARLWLMYKVESLKAAASMAVFRAQIVAHWVAVQAAALAAGARTAGAWILMTGAAPPGRQSQRWLRQRQGLSPAGH